MMTWHVLVSGSQVVPMQQSSTVSQESPGSPHWLSPPPSSQINVSGLQLLLQQSALLVQPLPSGTQAVPQVPLVQAPEQQCSSREQNPPSGVQ